MGLNSKCRVQPYIYALKMSNKHCDFPNYLSSG